MLDELRADIVSQLASSVTAFASVFGWGGRFSIESLQRLAAKTPSAAVAIEGARSSDLKGTALHLIVDFSCTIIVRGSSEETRDAATLALISKVMDAVRMKRWNDSTSGTPQNIQFATLFSDAIDSKGVSMSVVTWEQAVVIDDSSKFASLDDFDTFHARYKLDADQTEELFSDGVVNF